jgi:hypothetical protein
VVYVYANSDGLVQNNASGGSVMLRPGDAWWADDPFVLSRPDLFSATPTVVHSTTGRDAPAATAVEPTPRRKAGARG